jgi:pimeloyl-ACP methyl ester carboxylesterase
MIDETPKDLYFERDGLKRHCLDWGTSGKRPLLLLHGPGDSAMSWDFFAQAMKADHHVVALDSRGHGDSDWAAVGLYTFANHMADVDAALNHLGFREVVLVGHSAGASYAWTYAAEHPSGVTALVVLDIDPDPTDQHRRAGPDAYRAGPTEWDSIDEVLDSLRQRQTFTSEEVLRHQAHHLTRPTSKSKLVWNRDPRVTDEHERPDLWGSWRRISCPTLILRGRQSTVLTHETAVRMRETLPGSTARLAELDGGGHWVHHDFPGAFHSTVRWFLEGLSDHQASSA